MAPKTLEIAVFCAVAAAPAVVWIRAMVRARTGRADERHTRPRSRPVRERPPADVHEGWLRDPRDPPGGG